MKPSQLAQSLKRIASQIEASKKPNKELVIRDLKKILIAANEGIADHDIMMEDLKATLGVLQAALDDAGRGNFKRLESVYENLSKLPEFMMPSK